MSDVVVRKVNAEQALEAGPGRLPLAGGAAAAMHMWRHEVPTRDKPARSRPYETVGYVLAGRAELHMDNEIIPLGPVDSWVVPVNVLHRYVILEPFTAVEATAPPASTHERR